MDNAIQGFWLWLDSIGQKYGIDMYVAVFLLVLVIAAVVVVKLSRGRRR
jgi:hypothetical protein